MRTAPAENRISGIDPAFSLLLWLALQLGALLLGSGRVRLSAGFPGQGFAVDEMLIAQFVFSGMLFPILLRDFWTSMAVFLTAAPMLQLAGVLSGTPWLDLVLAWCCLGFWVGALGVLEASLQNHRARATSTVACPSRGARSASALGCLIGLVNFISLGGLVLWYLESEFGGGSALSRFFPLPALLQALHGAVGFVLPLSSAGVILIASGLFGLIQRAANRR